MRFIYNLMHKFIFINWSLQPIDRPSERASEWKFAYQFPLLNSFHYIHSVLIFFEYRALSLWQIANISAKYCKVWHLVKTIIHRDISRRDIFLAIIRHNDISVNIKPYIGFWKDTKSPWYFPFNRGLCYPPKPKAEADNTNRGHHPQMQNKHAMKSKKCETNSRDFGK